MSLQIHQSHRLLLNSAFGLGFLKCSRSNSNTRTNLVMKKFMSSAYFFNTSTLLFSTKVISPQVDSNCRKLGQKSVMHNASFSAFWTNNEPFPNNFQYRFYSKGKDKPKSSKKQSVVKINEVEMNQIIDVATFKSQLGNLIDEMKKEYTNQLNVRGTAGALETLPVEYDGEKYPLQELAQVGRKNPQLAVLNFGALPDTGPAIMKAIQESGMNLNPQQEGTTIYIPLPKMTREHRENMAKSAKAIFNKYKQLIQNVQNKHLKTAKSQDVSEDLIFSVTQQIMKMSENYIMEAEELMHSKQKELLET